MLTLSPFQLGDRPDITRGGVATIGVFDGVHLGHRAVLTRTREHARHVGGPAILITFSIHPDEVVKGRAPQQLLSPEHRARLFEEFGIDILVLIPFDQQLRNTSAEVFVKDVFVDAFGVRGLVLGHDTAFGKGRSGTPEVIRALGERWSYSVEVMPEVRLGEALISSTRIRERLLAGDIESAQQMLGRPVSLLGTVIKGDQRGRNLGFPTANLALGKTEAYPKEGVYAVRVHIDGTTHRGVCNIGRRPTFRVGDKPLPEVHVFDFQDSLYGQVIVVDFVARIRDEIRFSDQEALVAQIRHDKEQAREILGNLP